MTLARQLRLLFAGLAALVFVAVFLAGVWSGRHVLERDLAAQARAAGEALAAEVAAGLATADRAAVSRALDEAVAGKPLCAVRLELAGDGRPLERSTAQAAAPGWMTVLFPVSAAEASVPVGNAGQDLGRLTVRADPRAATAGLEAAALAALMPAAAAALAVLGLGLLAVGPLTRPYRDAEAEAATALRWEPVGEGPARADEPLPATRLAVRELARRARLLLEGVQGLAATLHARASRDALTGLASRHRLLDVLEARRRDPAQAWTGGLLIVQLDGLKAINETFGYAAGDEVLRECARLLEETFGAEPGALVAHLAGGEFAVLVPCAAADALAERAAAADSTLAGLASRLRFPSSLMAYVGRALYRGQGISALFAEADRSLRQAQWRGIPGVANGAQSPAELAEHGAAARRAAALAALRRGGLRLVLQPVVACETRELLHHEAYARIHAEDGAEPCPIGELVAGGEPAVVLELDRAAIVAALRILADGRVGGDLALNLSAASVRDAGFPDWLAARCREEPAAARRLVLELADVVVPTVLPQLASLLARLRPVGLRFAVDHFGAGPAAFRHLRSLEPSYLKIDGSFAGRLDRDAEAQCFVRATAQIAQGLGLPAYLEAVETEAVWALLPSLQLDGAQGYHLGRPR